MSLHIKQYKVCRFILILLLQQLHYFIFAKIF